MDCVSSSVPGKTKQEQLTGGACCGLRLVEGCGTTDSSDESADEEGMSSSEPSKTVWAGVEVDFAVGNKGAARFVAGCGCACCACWGKASALGFVGSAFTDSPA